MNLRNNSARVTIGVHFLFLFSYVWCDTPEPSCDDQQPEQAKIKPLGDTTWVYKLNGVKFCYKDDPSERTHYGWVAKELDRIKPGLMAYNEKNEPIGIKYLWLFLAIIEELKHMQKRVDQLSVAQKRFDHRLGVDEKTIASLQKSLSAVEKKIERHSRALGDEIQKVDDHVTSLDKIIQGQSDQLRDASEENVNLRLYVAQLEKSFDRSIKKLSKRLRRLERG